MAAEEELVRWLREPATWFVLLAAVAAPGIHDRLSDALQRATWFALFIWFVWAVARGVQNRRRRLDELG